MPPASRQERASALRQKIATLDSERSSLLRTLLELRDLFAASISIVYRTCGKAHCTCTRGQPHGPYFFLSIQSGGRNDRYHLSKIEAKKVQPAIDRYRLFLKTLRRLRTVHRQIEAQLRSLQSLCEKRSIKSFTTS